MCGNEEFVELAGMFNEFHTFTLWGIRHILNSTDVDKVTWFTNNSTNTSRRSDSYSFVDTLYSAGLTLFTKNHRTMGNFVLTGKRGFDILRQIGRPRFDLIKGRYGILDSLMRVYYIPSMDDNRFIVSVYEPLYFKNDNDYKSYFKMYQNMDDMIVGEIIDGERPKDNIEEKSRADDKHETVSTNSIKWNSKTHLIYGQTGCGKTTMFKQIIQDKLRRDEDVFVLGTEVYGRLYFNDMSNSKLHFYSPKEVSSFSSKVAPKDLAEYIVNFCYAVSGKDSIRTIAIDGFEQFALNPDYTMSEYFRELAKECRTKDINFLYTLGIDSDKKESCNKIPEIYERFSDTITVLK